MENIRRARTEEKNTNFTDENLITDIISRLPAKDLMRFTCVSKSWHSLIDSDSYLASLQLQRTASSHRPSLVFRQLRHRTDEDGGWPHYYICFDLDEPQNIRRQIHDPLHDDHDPKRGCLTVYDSCHGLLVLVDDRTMAVSNPTTKKYHIVPPNPAIYIGFGYDYRRCCYKLVSIIEPGLTGDDHVLELMVYDVKGAGNEWRKARCDVLELMTYADNVWIYPHGAYVDGALYWYLNSKTMIIGFDLAEEKFFETALPDFGDVFYEEIWIKEFDGHLCLLCDRNNRQSRVDFWVMDRKCDDGSSKWTKFLTMSPPGRDMVLRDCGYPRVFPVCFSSCRNKILFEVYGQELWWYEPKTKQYCKLKTCALQKRVFVPKTSCIRSLIGNGIF